ncbi:ROK family protein [Terriglobus tenax]|uniref:ROK family protein n=1 Tax=Terriglobus tenax TaxID=1111115 RepID=UPI0021DF98E3|nr:ROK family protein [Terriglobus tenax]
MRENSPCSRADLVRLSGLSAPTVTAAIADLEALDLIEYLGEGVSSGGRPGELLRFRPEHAYVAGADIGGTRLRMMLANLDGKPVAQWACKLGAKEKDPASICQLLRDGLKQMCEDAKVAFKKVKHLTVGAPGVTDVARGVVLSAPNLTDWNDVPLRALLEEKLGFEVIAENDTNLAAVGEHWHGAAENVDDFVFIAMGTGVGAGVFLGGQIHHGSAWSAGEIGYLGVPGMAREPMEMRRTGQLERVIGGAGIEAQWQSELERTKQGSAELRALRASQIFELAATGNPQAKAVLQNTARILGDAIATITLLFNPSLVVMGGGVGSHAALCEAVGGVLAESDFPHPQVRCSVLGPEAQLYGSVALSLQAMDGKLLG